MPKGARSMNDLGTRTGINRAFVTNTDTVRYCPMFCVVLSLWIVRIVADSTTGEGLDFEANASIALASIRASNQSIPSYNLTNSSGYSPCTNDSDCDDGYICGNDGECLGCLAAGYGVPSRLTEPKPVLNLTIEIGSCEWGNQTTVGWSAEHVRWGCWYWWLNLPTSPPTCEKCPYGTYSPRGHVYCGACPGNEWNRSYWNQTRGTAVEGATNETDCEACSASVYPCLNSARKAACLSNNTQYQESGGTLIGRCEFCPDGTQLNVSTNVCEWCGTNEYYNVTGHSCEACPERTVSLGSVEGMVTTDCESCQEHTLYNATTKECVACPLGSFAGINATTCAVCEDDESFNVTASACEACLQGKVRVGNGVNCTWCGANLYFNNVTKNCDPCDEDWRSNATSVVCVECEAGKGRLGDASECDWCVDNWYYNGSTGCQQCPENTYWNATNTSVPTLNCTQCPIFEGRTPQEDECTPCGNETYYTGGGCQECPLNEVANSSQPDSCVPCPEGEGRSATQRVCTPCENNTYWDGGCVPCSSTEYSNVETNMTCRCILGHGRDINGDCTPCRPGEWCEDDIKYRCRPGFECPLWRMDGPISCANSTIAHQFGASSCIACPSGTTPNENKTRCELIPCDSSERWDGTSCGPCPQGWDNSTGCTRCERGYEYVNNMCTQCPLGKYAPDVQGDAVCLECEEGKVGRMESRTECRRCDLGQKPNVHKTACEGCEGTSGYLCVGGEEDLTRCNVKKGFCNPKFGCKRGIDQLVCEECHWNGFIMDGGECSCHTGSYGEACEFSNTAKPDTTVNNGVPLENVPWDVGYCECFADWESGFWKRSVDLTTVVYGLDPAPTCDECAMPVYGPPAFTTAQTFDSSEIEVCNRYGFFDPNLVVMEESDSKWVSCGGATHSRWNQSSHSCECDKNWVLGRNDYRLRRIDEAIPVYVAESNDYWFYDVDNAPVSTCNRCHPLYGPPVPTVPGDEVPMGTRMCVGPWTPTTTGEMAICGGHGTVLDRSCQCYSNATHGYFDLSWYSANLTIDNITRTERVETCASCAPHRGPPFGVEEPYVCRIPWFATRSTYDTTTIPWGSLDPIGRGAIASPDDLVLTIELWSVEDGWDVSQTSSSSEFASVDIEWGETPQPIQKIGPNTRRFRLPLPSTVDEVECGGHGTFDPLTQKCQCDAPWTNDPLLYDACTLCSQGMGPLSGFHVQWSDGWVDYVEDSLRNIGGRHVYTNHNDFVYSPEFWLWVEPQNTSPANWNSACMRNFAVYESGLRQQNRIVWQGDAALHYGQQGWSLVDYGDRWTADDLDDCITLMINKRSDSEWCYMTGRFRSNRTECALTMMEPIQYKFTLMPLQNRSWRISNVPGHRDSDTMLGFGHDLMDVVHDAPHWNRAAAVCTQPYFAYSPTMEWTLCAGNGVPENGVCRCNDGWGGAECNICGGGQANYIAFRDGDPCRPNDAYDQFCRLRSDPSCPLACDDVNYEFRDCFDNDDDLRNPTIQPDAACVKMVLFSSLRQFYPCK